MIFYSLILSVVVFYLRILSVLGEVLPKGEQNLPEPNIARSADGRGPPTYSRLNVEVDRGQYSGSLKRLQNVDSCKFSSCPKGPSPAKLGTLDETLYVDYRNEKTNDRAGRDRKYLWIWSVISSSLVGLTGVLPLLLVNYIEPSSQSLAACDAINDGPCKSCCTDAGSSHDQSQKIDSKAESEFDIRPCRSQAVNSVEEPTDFKINAGSEQGRILKLMLSFAVGSLLGDVFLHLLPEAWNQISHAGGNDAQAVVCLSVGGWTIAGIMSFLLLEKLFAESKEATNVHYENQTNDSSRSLPEHIPLKSEDACNSTSRDCDESHCFEKRPSEDQTATHPAHKLTHIQVSGYLNLMANCIDNFTHGLAVAASYTVSYKVGVLTTVSILLHEVPHEFGDFAILLRSGFDRWKAAKCQFFTAAFGMLGAAVALSTSSPEEAASRVAWILPFTSGGFIYIALVTVLPDLLLERCAEQSLKQLSMLVLGVMVMYAVTVSFA